MAIPTLITELSTTAAANSPAGSDSPSTLDDIQRAHASFIAQLRDRDSAFALTLLDDANAAAARTTLGAAASGANTDITSLGSVASINGGQLAGMRNLLINGNLAINQRGYVSGAAVGAANTYTLDRWRVVTSGQNLTFTASGNGNSMTAPAGGVEQVIEGANIGGGTYVLGWTGTATATVNGTARAKGESFTLTANTNATVRLIGGSASLVQLEPGSTATPFEHRPYGMELALCQRYYQTIDAFNAIAGSATFLAGSATLPVFMRSIPTLSQDTTATFTDTQVNFTQSAVQIATTISSTSRVGATLANFTGLTAKQSYYFYTGSIRASAEI